MKITSDLAMSQAATSPVEADAGQQQTSLARVLYQPGAMFQSQVLKPGPQVAVGTASSVANPAAGFASAPQPNVTPSDVPFFYDSANGDTSLAQIMTRLGKPMTEADVEKALGPASPQDMLRFARDNGLEAEEYNNSSLDQLKQQIDEGHAVQAFIWNTSGGIANPDNMQYINITGYGTDPSTGEEYITYVGSSGTPQRMSVSDFKELWGSVPGGFHNYFQAYAPKGSNLPPGDDAFENGGGGIQGSQGTLNGAANVGQGWNLLTGSDSTLPDRLQGSFQLVGGIPQAAGSLLSEWVQDGASWLHDKVSGIPILESIVQPFTDVVGGIAGGAADLANGVGESASDLGAAASDLWYGDGHKALDKLGDAAKDLGNGVVHSVTDAASSVGHAIEDLFSW
jgi:hypothetical protein